MNVFGGGLGWFGGGLGWFGVFQWTPKLPYLNFRSFIPFLLMGWDMGDVSMVHQKEP